ncbi:WD repeat-containing protein AAC3-like [Protopterus annectens]|uniref:WD repeat-containing protein AAC3-like n=1 Tax=Protopterus annectens TaxID=7888 RepID=UPI001CF96EC6|nr:WD repeat-containing protein AAC3-like [Protopterus annectens]
METDSRNDMLHEQQCNQQQQQKQEPHEEILTDIQQDTEAADQQHNQQGQQYQEAYKEVQAAIRQEVEVAMDRIFSPIHEQLVQICQHIHHSANLMGGSNQYLPMDRASEGEMDSNNFILPAKFLEFQGQLVGLLSDLVMCHNKLVECILGQSQPYSQPFSSVELGGGSTNPEASFDGEGAATSQLDAGTESKRNK